VNGNTNPQACRAGAIRCVVDTFDGIAESAQ